MSKSAHVPEKDPLEDIPVDSTNSIMEVLQNPEYLKEWLENLDAPGLEQTREVTNHANAHTIGENIVRNIGLRPWPRVLETLEKQPHPVKGDPPHSILQHPRSLLDNILHVSELDDWRLDFEEFDELPDARRGTFEYITDPETTVAAEDLEAVGGTDAIVHGPMGRGKTTVVHTLLARISEINNETVVWRGTSQRTEWLPFAPWTIACLPADVEYTVTLAPPEDEFGFADDIDFDPIEVDLEDIVWKVRRYDGLEDLNQNVLKQGAFHVVFPDPMHRGCQRVTEEADECKVLDYTGQHEEADPSEVTPPSHWWFAWLVHHNTFGRSMRLTWVCDEASNLFEDHASNDDHNLDRKIKAVGDQYIDFRRNGLSVLLLSQKIAEISWRIRKKMRWAVTLSGVANPVDEEVIGAGSPPMESELTTSWPIGKAIFWTAGAYTEFDWDDFPRRLKVPGKIRVVPKEVAT